MTTAIIDYGSGNLRSAAKAFERAAAENGLPGEIILVTSRPEEVAPAERIVLPGVGAFADCRRGLAAVPGLEAALGEAVMGRGRPFLGICVGMQLMADRGREFETVDGLGWIPGEVVAIERAEPSLKIPHMGWNELTARRASGAGRAARRDPRLFRAQLSFPAGRFGRSDRRNRLRRPACRGHRA